MPLGNAHEIIKKIIAALFTAEERRLGASREVLITANAEFYPGRPHDGFIYQGKPYDRANLVNGRRTRISLHFEMVSRMDAHLADEEKVWSDRHYISQMLFTVLQPCSDWQDIRDALPNCLVDTLPELRSYQRNRPEAYTIQSDTRTVRQFNKILPRIEFYATARLLY